MSVVTFLRRARLGSALLLTMTMLFVMVLVIGAVGNLSQMNSSSVAVRRWQKQARFAGYAGLQDALSRCTANPAYSAAITPTPLDGDPDTLYQVDIFNNFGATTGQFAPDNKTWVPPGAIYLFSLGTLRGRNAQGSGGYVAVAGVQRPRFDLALYCEAGGIQLNNSNVVVWDPATTPTSRIAHVSSNLRSGLAIQSVNSNVQGKLICGPGLNVGTSVLVSGGSNSGLESGVSAKILTPFFSPVYPTAIAPPISGPDYYLYAGGYGDVVVPAGTTLELAPTTGTGARTYTFRSLTLMPGANIKVTTTADYPITVYCTNSFDAQGNNDINWNAGATQPNDPQRLQLYFTGSAATQLNINNCPHVSMVSAGKGTTVHMNNSDVWGSVMARSATLSGGSTLHYDVRLTGVMLDGQGEMALLNVTDVAPAEATQAIALTTTVATAAATGTPPAAPPPPPPGPTQPPPTGFVAAAPAAPATAPAAPAAPATVPAAPAAPAATVPAAPAPAAPAATVPAAPAPAAPAATVPAAPAPAAPAATVPAAPAPAAPAATVPAAPAPAAPAATVPAAPAPAAPAATVPAAPAPAAPAPAAPAATVPAAPATVPASASSATGY